MAIQYSASRGRGPDPAVLMNRLAVIEPDGVMRGVQSDGDWRLSWALVGWPEAHVVRYRSEVDALLAFHRLKAKYIRRSDLVMCKVETRVRIGGITEWHQRAHIGVPVERRHNWNRQRMQRRSA